MFCPNCGSNIPDDSVFCENCGANLQETVSGQTQSPVQPQEVQSSGYGSATRQTGNTNEPVSDDQKPDKQEQTKRVVIIVAIAVLFIVLVRAISRYAGINLFGIFIIALILGILTRFYIDKRKK